MERCPDCYSLKRPEDKDAAALSDVWCDCLPPMPGIYPDLREEELVDDD